MIRVLKSSLNAFEDCLGDASAAKPNYLKRVVIALAACAALLKLYMAFTTHGTLDTDFWQWAYNIIQVSDGIELYHRNNPFNPFSFNPPPFNIHLVRVLGNLSEWTGIALGVWLRVLSVLADVGVLVVVWKYLACLPRLRHRPLILMLLAICPVSILLAGNHANTDPTMTFLLVLAVYLVETDKPLWLAGCVFGLATCFKIVPVMFIAPILFFLPNLRKRLLFIGSAGLTFFVFNLPYLLQDPPAIIRVTFGYSSIPGEWGWTALYMDYLRTKEVTGNPLMIGGDRYLLIVVAKYLLFALVAALSWWMNKRRPRPALFLQCGAIAYLFVALTPGFGVQYVAWLVPWVTVLGLYPVLLFYSVGWFYLYNVYVSQFIPNGFYRVGLVCWVTVSGILFWYYRAIKHPVNFRVVTGGEDCMSDKKEEVRI